MCWSPCIMRPAGGTGFERQTGRRKRTSRSGTVSRSTTRAALWSYLCAATTSQAEKLLQVFVGKSGVRATKTLRCAREIARGVPCGVSSIPRRQIGPGSGVRRSQSEVGSNGARR
ncbi:unnamed protein product [Ectocarpus fasciculatus]